MLLAAAGTALADGGPSAMPGMTAEEHARMTGHDTSTTARPVPGMTAEEHAKMTGGGHAMSGMVAHGDSAASSGGRPVGLVLGGFVALNLLALLAAAIVRRRGPSAKRRAAKARVRAAAGASMPRP